MPLGPQMLPSLHTILNLKMSLPRLPSHNTKDALITENKTITKFLFIFFSIDLPHGSLTYRLEDLAYTRSGDKGNSANIGVVARHPLYYPYLKKILTAQAIEDYFQHLLHKEGAEETLVTRYELPGIYALNFVLKNSLGGGGIASLRNDPQGKALGQMLLDFQIKNVPDLKSLVE
ncbi:uncharacterized protein ACOB8E_004674 [Sarcophilus harrisii]